MKPKKLLAIISRRFFEENNVIRYRMQKVADMNDDEVIQKCHFYCEHNTLTKEWNAFRNKLESKYRYCDYLEEYINEELCYDLQLFSETSIKSSALSEIRIDKEECAKCCFKCKYSL